MSTSSLLEVGLCSGRCLDPEALEDAVRALCLLFPVSGRLLAPARRCEAGLVLPLGLREHPWLPRVCVHSCESCPADSRHKNAPNVSLLAEMLQFVSNQAGDFPDLFSDPLCGTFQGGSSSSTTTSSSSSSSGTLDPPRPYGQAPLQPFPPPAASPQLQSVPVKAPPQRPAPLLQPRPQLQPQLQQQTVMIAPTFSSAPQTRIIQQPVIYQNTATSFQGRAWGGAVLAAHAQFWSHRCPWPW